MNAIKKKYKSCSIKEKEDILECLEKGESITELSSKHQVSSSFIYKLKKEKEKFKRNKESFGKVHKLKDRKRFRKAKYEKLDVALHAWFLQMRAKGFCVSGDMLSTKALIFHKTFYNDVFYRSSGFLRNFKARYGISEKVLKGEKQSSDLSAAEEYCISFATLRSQYDPDTIYNMDEYGLFWRALPQKTLSDSNDQLEVSIKQK